MAFGLRDSARSTTTGFARKIGAVGVAVIVLLTSVVVLPPTAVAAPELNVVAGFGGRHRSGSDLFVQVDVTADRLIDGELHIVRGNGASPVTVVVPLEIAGGARKRVQAVVPAYSSLRHSLDVRLIDGGQVVATANTRPNDEREDELVGVLPSLHADMPASAELSVPLGVARLFAIDDGVLALGPGAIDSLGTVIASSQDLSQLSDRGRASLVAWTEMGGSLVIDELPGLVTGLDASAEVTPQALGRGSLVATGASFATGQWDGLLAPTPFPIDLNGPGGIVGEMTGEVVWFGGPLSNSLASDAGFGLPSLRVVLPLMALYVLIIGPIAWLVLRRLDRSRLFWVVLPAVAALFTGIVWLGGTALRSATTDAHGTVIEIGNGTATARTITLRSSRSGGTIADELPPQWRPIEPAEFNFGGPGTTNVTVRPGLQNTAVSASLDAGEFVLLGATGPAPAYRDALLVSASSAEDGRIDGTITNQLGVGLDEVAVFAGYQGINVGTVGAGETIEFSIVDGERNPRFAGPIEMDVWRDAIENGQFGRFDRSVIERGVINIELWANYVNANVGSVRPQGTVTAVGWTRDLPAPMGDNINSGRTAVISRSLIEAARGQVTDVAGGRTLLRSDDGRERQFAGNGFALGSTWRLDVPSGMSTELLALGLPQRLVSIELWNGTDWVIVENPAGGVWAIPEGSFVAGSLYVRPTVDFEQGAALGSEFSLQTVTNADALIGDLLIAPGSSS